MSTPPLFHRQLGYSGPLVAFLPGLGLTTRYWESRVSPLASSHRLLLVDLLGFGQSPKPWTRYTVDAHIDALHGVLGNAGPVTLVGHSAGAILAVAYAARYPADVRGLVLFGLPRFHGEEEARRLLRGRSTLDRWVLNNIVFASIACVLTRRVTRRLLPTLLPGLPREVVEDYVQHTWRSATSTVREVVYRHDVDQDAGRLSPALPVLLLHGTQDRTAPIDGARELVRRHPGWRLREFAGGDHNLLLRDPEWCVAEMRRFLHAHAVPAGVPMPRVAALVSTSNP